MENPSVHPFKHSTNRSVRSSEGMTLLDYYAGQFLQGIIADSHSPYTKYSEIADKSYEMAAAMLKVRREVLKKTI